MSRKIHELNQRYLSVDAVNLDIEPSNNNNQIEPLQDTARNQRDFYQHLREINGMIKRKHMGHSRAKSNYTYVAKNFKNETFGLETNQMIN